jgi:hypothetical protein
MVVWRFYILTVALQGPGATGLVVSSSLDGQVRLRSRWGWLPAESWQYITRSELARIFVMRLRLARIIPMIATVRWLSE